MKIKFHICITLALLVGAAVIFAVEHGRMERLRQQVAILKNQIASMQLEDSRQMALARTLADCESAVKEVNDLTRLRHEVETLREQASEMEKLHHQNREIYSRLTSNAQ